MGPPLYEWRVNEALGCRYSRRRVSTRAEGGPAGAAPGRRQRPHCPPSDSSGEQKDAEKVAAQSFHSRIVATTG